MTTNDGRAPSGQALAVPATPLRVDGPAGFDPSRCGEPIYGEKDLGGVTLAWAAQMVPAKVCEGGGWYSRDPSTPVLVFRCGPLHKYNRERLLYLLPDCEYPNHGPSSIGAALEHAEHDLRKRFRQAIAMEAAKPSRRETGSTEGDSAGPKDIAQRTTP